VFFWWQQWKVPERQGKGEGQGEGEGEGECEGMQPVREAEGEGKRPASGLWPVASGLQHPVRSTPASPVPGVPVHYTVQHSAIQATTAPVDAVRVEETQSNGKAAVGAGRVDSAAVCTVGQALSFLACRRGAEFLSGFCRGSPMPRYR
jgi:hypothetical protein